MFYFTAFTFYPVFLLLIVPVGLLVSGLFRVRDEDDRETDIATSLAPLAGLAMLVTVPGLAVRAGAVSYLIPLIVALNLGAASIGIMRGSFMNGWRRLAAPLLIGFFSYLILISPLLIDGDFSVLGYNTNNDPVFHAIIPEYIENQGYSFPTVFKSGFAQAAIDKLSQQGYPDGWHQALMLARRIYSLRAYHMFNITVAFFASMLALVGYAWSRQARLDRSWALAGGAAAALGYLQLSYAFQGFAPQVAVTPFLYAAMLALHKLIFEKRRAYFLPAVLFIQAGLAIYSFTILLWLGFYLMALAAARLARREFKELAGDLPPTMAAFGLGMILNPFVLSRLYTSFQAVIHFSDSDGLGNLVSAAVPILPLLYIWPVGDHRLLPVGSLNHLTYIPAAVVVALIVAGLLSGGRRRFWLTAAIAVIGPMIAVKIWVGPYYFAKTLQMGAPFVGLAVVAGLFRVRHSAWRHPALAAAGVLLVGAVISNVALTQVISTTPIQRFSELLEINEKFGSAAAVSRDATETGRDPALFVSRGEDWGPYLLSNFMTASPLARTYQGMAPGIRGATDIQAAIKVANDIDDLYGVQSTRFDWLIIDRAHDMSLPPPPFELAYSGSFYTVYERVGPPSRAISHIPAENAVDPYSPPYLEVPPGQTALIPVEGKFSSVQVSGYLFPHVVIEPQAWRTESTAWQHGEANGLQVLNMDNQPGRASSSFELYESGPFDIFLSGDLGERLMVSVNGQTMATRGERIIPAAGPGPAWWRWPDAATGVGVGQLELAAESQGSGSYVGKVLLADLEPKPGDQVVFSVGHRSVKTQVGRLPAVYAIPLRSDSTAAIRVKNVSAHPLRLDWIEPHGMPYDREALFRYNRNNKLAFQSIARLVSR